MQRLIGLMLTGVAVFGVTTTAAAQQDPAPAVQTVTPASAIADPAASPVPAAQIAETGAGRALLKDVIGDYKRFPSRETVAWLGAGLGASLAVHVADEALRDDFQTEDGTVIVRMHGGQWYGNIAMQLPLAVGWWVVGSVTDSSRAVYAGRDLVRAQISAVSWTYLLKYAVQRTRPNGDPRSFPSGHASASFATAVILQEHYGWKVGVPFFAAAAYTAASRVANNKHWASDAVFGSFLGVASARVVTFHVRSAHLSVAPAPEPGGGAVVVSVTK